MAASGSEIELRSSRARAVARQLGAAVSAVMTYAEDAAGSELGELLILIRDAGIDPLEAAFATGVRRFGRSGEYKADGALSLIAWLRWKCKLSGGAAMERVQIARQLEKLPETQAAFASGTLGYQHVAVLAHTAEHVGAAAVRKEGSHLLQAAKTMDPGQFVTVAKNFEHRVDAAGALAEANRAYERRYLSPASPDGASRRLVTSTPEERVARCAARRGAVETSDSPRVGRRITGRAVLAIMPRGWLTPRERIQRTTAGPRASRRSPQDATGRRS